MIKIYGVHGSPFVRKVFIMLDIKGIEYETVQQMPFSGDKDYRKINPLAKVPSLVDGDLTLCDSKVICRYLESAYPDPALYPTKPTERALADWYEELGGTRVTELATGIFFERFMRPRAFNQDPNEEEIEKIITKRLPPLLTHLEDIAPADGYIFGEFSIADLALVSPLFNAAYVGYEVDPLTWPNLSNLIKRVKAIPEVKAVLEIEAKIYGLN
ncbi:MAG: glutathione S-transferase family protein [Pseudomonadota bacterium]